MSRLYDTAAAEQVNNARFYVCRYHKMHNFHWYLCITVTHRRTTLRPHTTTDVGLPHMYVPQGTDNVCQTDGHQANSSIDKAADMVWCQKRPSLSAHVPYLWYFHNVVCFFSFVLPDMARKHGNTDDRRRVRHAEPQRRRRKTYDSDKRRRTQQKGEYFACTLFQ